ncbi:hypothetical protein BHM03_00012278, partial [Ensete ventricosum]
LLFRDSPSVSSVHRQTIFSPSSPSWLVLGQVQLLLVLARFEVLGSGRLLCVNVLLTNPIWVVVTRMQVQELYDEAGFWGFWKGVIPTLIMVSRK